VKLRFIEGVCLVIELGCCWILKRGWIGSNPAIFQSCLLQTLLASLWLSVNQICIKYFMIQACSCLQLQHLPSFAGNAVAVLHVDGRSTVFDVPFQTSA
jgi:hypothetical protein